MKKFFFLISLFFAWHGQAQDASQTGQVDPVAVLILDKMSDLIGDLESCSFEVSNRLDVNDPDHGWVTEYSESTIIFDGPDKMHVHRNGEKGKEGFWYNGQEVSYYSYDQNNFVRIPAPDNTLATIDTLNIQYGTEIPAADFFYPAFTDDLLQAFPTILYLGKKPVDGEECYHIKASNDEMEVQFWISDKAYKLPVRYGIVYKKKSNMQYESHFTNWDLNPVIPPSVFDFMPPKNATAIKILAKTNPPK
ncbi:MAG: DUF2092 domain-containing protein [Lutimonas sp.]